MGVGVVRQTESRFRRYDPLHEKRGGSCGFTCTNLRAPAHAWPPHAGCRLRSSPGAAEPWSDAHAGCGRACERASLPPSTDRGAHSQPSHATPHLPCPVPNDEVCHTPCDCLQIYDCRAAQAVGSSNDACGTALPYRAQFDPNFCPAWEQLQAGNLSLINALRGMVIDVVIVDPGVEAVVRVDQYGQAWIQGMTGEIINEIAIAGGFRWRALFVAGPDEDYRNSSRSWVGGESPVNNWLVDWANRADILTTWFDDSVDRRDAGKARPRLLRVCPVHACRDITRQSPTCPRIVPPRTQASRIRTTSTSRTLPS